MPTYQPAEPLVCGHDECMRDCPRGRTLCAECAPHDRDSSAGLGSCSACMRPQWSRFEHDIPTRHTRQVAPRGRRSKARTTSFFPESVPAASYPGANLRAPSQVGAPLQRRPGVSSCGPAGSSPAARSSLRPEPLALTGEHVDAGGTFSRPSCPRPTGRTISNEPCDWRGLSARDAGEQTRTSSCWSAGSEPATRTTRQVGEASGRARALSESLPRFDQDDSETKPALPSDRGRALMRLGSQLALAALTAAGIAASWGVWPWVQA